MIHDTLAPSRVWLDRLGTVASAACAVHCGVLALAPALLPLLGLGFLHDESAEWAFVAAAVVFAAVAGALGHRTHGAWSVSLGFLFGMLALVGARVGEELGLEGGFVLAGVGGAALVVSHLFNLRRCRACAAGTCG